MLVMLPLGPSGSRYRITRRKEPCYVIAEDRTLEVYLIAMLGMPSAR